MKNDKRLNSGKNFVGIVELHSTINGVTKKVKTLENIATRFQFYIGNGNINGTTLNITVVNTDAVEKDIPHISSTAVLTNAAVTRRISDLVLSSTLSDIDDTSSYNREFNCVARFSANGSVQPIDSVMLTTGLSTILAYTKLDVPYQQQAAESIEIRYRLIMVIDPAVSYSVAEMWRRMVHDYNDGYPMICGVKPTVGIGKIPRQKLPSTGTFNPARDFLHLGLVMRSLGSTSAYNGGYVPSVGDYLISGLRPIEGLDKIPGLPVGNIMNHSAASHKWEEDLTNLAIGKGAVVVGAGSVPTYLDAQESDMAAILINKTGEIGTAKYSFTNRPVGMEFPTVIANKKWGFLSYQNRIVRVEDKVLNLADNDTNAYGIDGSHLLIFQIEKIIIQYVDELKIEVFDPTTNLELSGLGRLVSIDRISPDLILATDGAVLLKIENVVSGVPTFTILPNSNIGGEAPKAVTVSDTHIFVATDNNIYQADLDGTNWVLKVALPGTMLSGVTSLIINADETEGFVGALTASQSQWYDIANGTFIAINLGGTLVRYSESFKMWMVALRHYKWGTASNRYDSGAVSEIDGVMYSSNSSSAAIPKTLKGLFLDINLLRGASQDTPLNTKSSTCNFTAYFYQDSIFYISPSIYHEGGSFIPRNKYKDKIAGIKDYRFDGVNFVEGHVAPINVSSGTNLAPMLRSEFAADSYKFKGWQMIEASENIKFNLTAGFSLSTTVVNDNKFETAITGVEECLFQLVLAKDSGIDIYYRNLTNSISILESKSDATIVETVVALTPVVGSSNRITVGFATGGLTIYNNGNLLINHVPVVDLNIDNTAGAMKLYLGLQHADTRYGCLFKESGFSGTLENFIIYNKQLTLAEVGEDNTNGVTTNAALVVSRALLTEDLTESKVLSASETMPNGVVIDFVDTISVDDSFVDGDYYNFPLISDGFLKDNVTEFSLNFDNPKLPLRATTLNGLIDNTIRTVTEPMIINQSVLEACTGFLGSYVFNLDLELFNNNISGKYTQFSSSTSGPKFNSIIASGLTQKGLIDTVLGQVRYDGVDIIDVTTLTSMICAYGAMHEMIMENNLPARVHRLAQVDGLVQKGAYAPDFQKFEEIFNQGVTVTVAGNPRTVIVQDDITLPVAAGTVHLSFNRALIKFTSADVGSAYIVDGLKASVRGTYTGL